MSAQKANIFLLQLKLAVDQIRSLTSSPLRKCPIQDKAVQTGKICGQFHQR